MSRFRIPAQGAGGSAAGTGISKSGNTLSVSQTYINSQINGFRLTLATGTPVTTADQTGKTIIYLTPHTGDRIAVFDGTNWSVIESAEISLELGTLTADKNYDVFVYSNSGTLTIDTLVAWTDDTNRATALTRQDGALVKTGATTRRYVGTLRTTSTTATEDSAAKRFLWNQEGRRPRRLFKAVSSSHSYSTATWRAWGNDATNIADFVCGDVLDFSIAIWSAHRTDTDNARAVVGIDLDTTSAGNLSTATDALIYSNLATSDSIGFGASTVYSVAAGRHYVFMQELGAGSGTQTFDSFHLSGVLMC